MSYPDVNFTSYSDISGLDVYGIQIIPSDPEEWDDSLKISHCISCHFSTGVVVGGSENALDMNRSCSVVTVDNLELRGGDQASIVVKGGCRGILLSDLVLSPSSKAWTDILWDDWSKTGRQASFGTLKNVRRSDGKPIRVVFGRFRRPKIEDTPHRILWLSCIGLHLYNLCKDVLVGIGLVKA